MQVEQNHDIPRVEDAKVAIVRSSWYGEYTDRLEHKCTEVLKRGGCSIVDVHELPGCLELPLAVRRLIRTGRYDVVICFGILMKGETYHFEMILEMLSHQLSEIMLEEDFPVVVEVLPVTDVAQLESRCGDNEFNKGIEAARTALHVNRRAKLTHLSG